MSSGQALAPESITGLTPFLIVITICAPLWGVTIAQSSAYYRNYPRDSRFLKSLVAACVFLNTAQLVAIVYTVYFWMIVCRLPENYPFLGTLSQGLVVLPAYLTYFLTSVVQCFYAMRVWFVSSKSIPLVGIVVFLSLTQLGGGFALVSYMVSVNSIVAVYSRFNHIAGGIELASSMLCDIIISTSLVYYLRRSRGDAFRVTKYALDKLILYSVNIGLLTVLVVLANLITWLAAPESDFTWAVFHFSLGKVYVNSMLVSLNARKKIRHQLSSGKKAFISSLDIDGALRFNSSGVTQTEIAMKDINSAA